MTIHCGVTGATCELHGCKEHSCVLYAAGVTKAMAQKPIAEMAKDFAAGSTASLLNEREKTYGSFSNVALVAQRLKNEIGNALERRRDRGQKSLTFDQHEALDCIAMKMARILSGDPDYADNWDDIAGYAKLCSKPPLKMDWSNPTVDRRTGS